MIRQNLFKHLPSFRTVNALICVLAGLAPRANANPPTIVYEPQSQSALFHQQSVFGVIASGTQPLYYQWHKNGLAIPDATGEQIILAHPEFSDTGQYTVTVSNTEGSAMSTNAALSIRAPKPGDLDYSFVWGGSIYGAVRCMALQSDGKMVIGGAFTTINGAVRGNVARLNSDGTADYTFLSGLTGADATVYAVATQLDGKIVIGGSFTNVNGVPRNHIARLNADGSLDHAFLNRETGLDQDVYAVAVQNDGKILVGGAFYYVNGVGLSPIARLNADGSIDGSFQARTCCTVYSIALQTDGKIIMGGSFSSINTSTRQAVARLNTDGTVDQTFQNGLAGAAYSVMAVALQSDGKVLLGGDFTFPGSISRLARLNTDGTLDGGFSTRGADNIVYSIVVQPSNKILVGGVFNNISGVAKSAIAQLNPDGSADTNFQAAISGSGYNAGVAAYVLNKGSDGKVFIGGNFSALNGTNTSLIGRLNQDGTTDTNFQEQSRGPNFIVRALVSQADGSWVAGGSFSVVDGLSHNLVVRFQADGAVDAEYGKGIFAPVLNKSIFAVAQQDDGRTIIAGTFQTTNAVSFTNIARLNPDGTLDLAFAHVLFGHNNDVIRAVAIQPDGGILIGGSFNTIDNSTRNNIARLNSGGTLDSTFQNGFSGANNAVYSIIPLTSGQVIIGGAFITLNGTNRTRVARLNNDGSLDTSFQDGLSGLTGTVSSLALQSDEKILVGGDYSVPGTNHRLRIARLNTDGTLDAGFQSGATGADGPVNCLAQQADGKVLVGGRFNTVNGVPCNQIARLNSDGSLDTNFSAKVLSAQSGEAYVSAVAVQTDGQIMIGGLFTTVNDAPAAFIARLWAKPMPFIQRLDVSQSNATLTLSLPSGTTNRVQYKNDLNDTAWADLPGDIVGSGQDQLTNKVDTTLGASARRFYRLRQLP